MYILYIIVFHCHCADAALIFHLLYGEEQSEVRQRHCLEALRNPVIIALPGMLVAWDVGVLLCGSSSICSTDETRRIIPINRLQPLLKIV